MNISKLLEKGGIINNLLRIIKGSSNVLPKNIRQSISLTILLCSVLIFTNSCFTVKYSFSGASIHPDIKTASVQYFQNRASYVEPALSQDITEKLKEKIESQTRLIVVNGTGDVDFEGIITGFETRPTAIQANDVAAQNRFTISIKVRYTNTVEPDNDYESTFSRSRDNPSSETIEQAKSNYTDELVELLIDDIFNKAFVNW